MSTFSIGLKTLILPEDLKQLIDGLHSEVRDYLAAYVLVQGGKTPEGVDKWKDNLLEADVMVSLCQKLKEGGWAVKYKEDLV